MHDIETLTNEAFVSVLLEKKLTSDDLSDIINLLVDLGTLQCSLPKDYDANQLLSKALFLEHYLTKNQKTVYFGNIAALDEAKRLMNLR